MLDDKNALSKTTLLRVKTWLETPLIAKFVLKMTQKKEFVRDYLLLFYHCFLQVCQNLEKNNSKIHFILK